MALKFTFSLAISLLLLISYLHDLSSQPDVPIACRNHDVYSLRDLEVVTMQTRGKEPDKNEAEKSRSVPSFRSRFFQNVDLSISSAAMNRPVAVTITSASELSDEDQLTERETCPSDAEGLRRSTRRKKVLTHTKNSQKQVAPDTEDEDEAGMDLEKRQELQKRLDKKKAMKRKNDAPKANGDSTNQKNQDVSNSQIDSPYATRPKRARRTVDDDETVDIKPDVEELNRIRNKQGSSNTLHGTKNLRRSAPAALPKKSVKTREPLYVPIDDATNDSEIRCTARVLRSRQIVLAANSSDSDSGDETNGYDTAPEYNENIVRTSKARLCLAEKNRRRKIYQEKALRVKMEKRREREAANQSVEDSSEEEKKPLAPKVKTRAMRRSTDVLEAGYQSAPEMRSTRTRNSAKSPDFLQTDSKPSSMTTKSKEEPVKQTQLKDESGKTKNAVPKETTTVEEKPVLDTKLSSISSSAKENKVQKRVQFMDVYEKRENEPMELSPLDDMVPTPTRKQQTCTETTSTSKEIKRSISKRTAEVQKSPIQKRETKKLIPTVKEENTYQMSTCDAVMASTSKSLPDPAAAQTKPTGPLLRKKISELENLILFPVIPDSQLTPDSLLPSKDDAAVQKSLFKIDSDLKPPENNIPHMSTRSSNRPTAMGVNSGNNMKSPPGSPAPKRQKLESPTTDEEKKEITPDSENVPRTLRPRPVKEIVEPKKRQLAPKRVKQDMSKLNGPGRSMSNLVERSLGKCSASSDYLNVFETNIKLYYHMAHRKSRVLLQRNLFYKNGNVPIELIQNYQIGPDAPPLVFNRLPRAQKKNPQSLTEKQQQDAFVTKSKRIGSIITIMIHQKEGKVSLPTKLGISPTNKFSLGNLAAAKNARNTKPYLLRLLEDRNASKILYNRPEEVPKKPEQPVEKTSVMLTPSNSRESSIKSGILIDSIVFTSCRHQTIPGKRVAWVTVYVAYEKRGHISKPCLVTGAFFPLWVNGKNRTSIELVKLQPNKNYEKLYIMAEIEMTKNLDSQKVEGGHSLRARRQVPETVPPRKKEKLRMDFPKYDRAQTELTYYGAVLYSEVDKGYNLGAVDIEIIPETSIRSRKEKPGFVEDVLNEIKKNGTNPFLTTETRRLDPDDFSPSEDEDDSDEDTEKEDEQKKQEEQKQKEEKEKENSQNTRRPPPKSKQSIYGKMRKCNFIRNFFDSYTGKFKWNKKGEYVNTQEMCRFLFQDQKILNNANKMKKINAWLPLNFPEKLSYRFLCCTEPDSTPEEEQSTRKKLSSVLYKKPTWMVSDKKEEPNRCIFCERKFNSLFFLMLHYNTSYPRLAFVFSFRERDINAVGDKSEVEEVFIDVMIDPNHVELNEIIPTKIIKPIRRPATLPKWLVTKKASLALRQTMRMDNTIFTRFLNVPEIVDETRRYLSRFVDINNGQPLTLCSKVNYDPKLIPQPAFEMLSEYLLRIVQDYIDIDLTTKNFMCTWNHLMMSIGRYNQVLLGAYLQHKLFVEVYWHVLNTEEDFRVCFCTQLVEYADTGVLSAEEVYDLWQRVFQQNYDPLKDPFSSIYQGIIDHCALKNRAMKRAAKRGKRLNPNYYPFYARQHPKRFSQAKRDQLVNYVYWKTKAINKFDHRRVFLVDPIKKLTSAVNEEASLRKFFRNLEHVDRPNGEFRMLLD